MKTINRIETIRMESIGLTPAMRRVADECGTMRIGRIIAQYRGLYRVLMQERTVTAELCGRLRHQAKSAFEYPAVGDFVLLESAADRIWRILPRRSALSRKAAGTAHVEQLLATNVDVVFICMSLNQDFNPRRLERYLSVVWDSGALPVIVLTKADLCADPASAVAQLGAAACGVDLLTVAALEEDGHAAILPYLGSGRTAAFIGSSGVGKSTLIGRLLGNLELRTQGLRNDDKGRHTTTNRELFVLADGGVIIDTPGMRELGLDSADLAKTFADIDELAKECRFRDCGHKSEPGCAVRTAIEKGLLDALRLESYQKLQKELRYEGLSAKQIEEAKATTMFAELGGMKAVRRMMRGPNRRDR